MPNLDLNTEENRNRIISFFPNLPVDRHFKVTSEETTDYNCIAYAMGVNCIWVDTEGVPWTWWPLPITGDNGVDLSPDRLVEAFAVLGFEECDNDSVEEGFEKVALYEGFNPNYGFDTWLHAARIMDSSIYKSKLGPSFDIEHSQEGVSGFYYGHVYKYMKRPIENRHLTQDQIHTEGSVDVDMSKIIL